MSFSDLAALGSLVSGVAVLISLVLLYYQLRQLTAQVRQADKYQQTLVKQARTGRVMEVNARLTDADFASVYLRIMANAEDLTLADWSRFNAHARAIFQNGEDTFSQHRRALLHPDDFDGFVLALSWTFRSPALRVAWKMHRGSFPAAYVAFVDRIVAESPVAPLGPEALEKWRQDLAAELATADTSSPPPRSTAT
ncbi:MAG TPA: hypothetical protein VHZ26_08035 [Caulobacteraceae bacterium]|jgi:hypothetical protein|nr:hypothetical protein [Caulobacteraceae bacterium]